MEADNAITEGQSDRWKLSEEKKAELEKQLSELLVRAGVEDKSKVIVRWFGMTINKWTEEALKLAKEKGTNNTPELFNPEKVTTNHVMAAQFIGALVRVFSNPIRRAMEARKRIQALKKKNNN